MTKIENLATVGCMRVMKAIFGISGIHYFSWDFWDFSFKPWDFWDFSMLFKIMGFGISILAAGIWGFYQSQKPFLGFFIDIFRNFRRYAQFVSNSRDLLYLLCRYARVVSMLVYTYQLRPRKGYRRLLYFTGSFGKFSWGDTPSKRLRTGNCPPLF